MVGLNAMMGVGSVDVTTREEATFGMMGARICVFVFQSGLSARCIANDGHTSCLESMSTRSREAKRSLMASTSRSFPLSSSSNGRSQSIFGGDHACGSGRFHWFVKIGGRLPAFALKIRICRIVSTNVRWVRLGQGDGGRTVQK